MKSGASCIYRQSDIPWNTVMRNLISYCSSSFLIQAILDLDRCLGVWSRAFLRPSGEYMSSPLPLERPCRVGSACIGVGGIGAGVCSSSDRLSQSTCRVSSSLISPPNFPSSVSSVPPTAPSSSTSAAAWAGSIVRCCLGPVNSPFVIRKSWAGRSSICL